MRDHTPVPLELARVAGLPIGRSFVVRFACLAHDAASHVDAVIAELRDAFGVWRDVDAKLDNVDKTRIFMGRDCPRAQLQTEIYGKRVVRLLARLRPKNEVVHRHRFGVVLVDRGPVAFVQRGGNGAPAMHWNLEELSKHSLEKDDLVAELSKDAPSDAAEISWVS